MPTPRQSLGQRGETLAAQHLRHHGYTIVDRNWRCPTGELDIIAHDGKEWVFVEVRARRAPDTEAAVESITSHKQARIVAAVEAYLLTHDLGEVAWRIDVVLVAFTPRGPQIEVIHNAAGW